MSNKDDGVVRIHGKEYLTVARRINDFRAMHPDYGVHTEILSIDENTVVCRAVITDAEGRQLSSGIAEEHRRASKINQTSATENCETSAVGRALAFLGMAGTEIASADEVAGAIAQQGDGDQYLIAHMNAARENFDEVVGIKEAIANEEWERAADLWGDVSDATRNDLWRATTKGGIWTIDERKHMDKEGVISKIIRQRKKDKAEEAA